MKVLSSSAKKIARNICGGLMIALGIIGLALPVLQGVVFIVAGFVMLDFQRKERLIKRAREHPLGRRLEEMWDRLVRRAR